MVKRDLVRTIAKKTGIIQQDVDEILNAALELIRLQVSEGKEVHIKEFGVFKPRIRAKRMANSFNGHPRYSKQHKAKPTPIVIPESVVPHFQPHKTFMKIAS